MWSGSRLGGSGRGANRGAFAFAKGDLGIPALDAVRGSIDAGSGVVRGVGTTARGAAVVAAADAARGVPEAGGGASVAEGVGVGGVAATVSGANRGFKATDIASSSEDVLALLIMKAAPESPTAVTTRATTTAVRVRRGLSALLAFATGFDVVVATSLSAPRLRALGESGAVPTTVGTLTAFLAT